MYHLNVFYHGERTPTHTEAVLGAAQALERMKGILAEHPACHRLEVYHGPTRLFAVDCAGNRVVE